MDGLARAALLVDLDGTLWDSGPWYAAILTERTGRAVDERVPVATALKMAGITPARFARLACDRAGDLKIFPGVGETLPRLRDLGVPLGAVTNLPRWIAEPMLDAHCLLPHLQVVITHGSTRAHKPRPAPILKALNDLGISPSAETWYVGDTEGDAQAAHAAGISFAWAGYAAAPPSGSAEVLSSFAEIEERVR